MLESVFINLSSFLTHQCFMFKLCWKLEPRLWWAYLSISFCCHHNILFTYLLLTDYTNNVELLKSWFHVRTCLELINKKEICSLLFWVDFLTIFLVWILLLFCNIWVITYFISFILCVLTHAVLYFCLFWKQSSHADAFLWLIFIRNKYIFTFIFKFTKSYTPGMKLHVTESLLLYTNNFEWLLCK